MHKLQLFAINLFLEDMKNDCYNEQKFAKKLNFNLPGILSLELGWMQPTAHQAKNH